MDVGEAVKRAKVLFSEVFGNEAGYPPTLEEVWFDASKDAWNVTIGLRRNAPNIAEGLSADVRDPLGRRFRPEYKVVMLRDDNGALLGIRDREFVEAA